MKPSRMHWRGFAYNHSMSDLFDHVMQERIKTEAPLTARMRPRTLEEFVGQEHIIGEGKLQRRAVEAAQKIMIEAAHREKVFGKQNHITVFQRCFLPRGADRVQALRAPNAFNTPYSARRAWWRS